MSLSTTKIEYMLRCPCEYSTSGVGLINHLDTKKRWYKLHQKKCNTCRTVRFEELTCLPTYNNLMGMQEYRKYLEDTEYIKYRKIDDYIANHDVIILE